MNANIQRHTSLSAHVVAFCRYLRQHGFPLGPLEEADALQALEMLTPFEERDQLRICLRIALARSLKQQEKFDALYADYWVELDKAVNAKEKKGEQEERQEQAPRENSQPSLQALKTWLYGNEMEEEVEMATYSDYEVLSKKNFSALKAEEMQEVMELIQRIARMMAMRFNRRRERSRYGQFDLRRSLRANMRRGGEIVEVLFKKPQRNRTKIVLLCDVSKSMDLYSRFLIRFVYAFQNVYRKIETFVFSTHLYRISEQLYRQEFGDALEQIQDNVEHWSGGTKIGESLQTFTKRYGHRMLDNKTIVLIMSDGWDTGAVDELEEAMRIIHRKAAKVIWMNPMAGQADYRPETAGMKAALPYIDVLVPAHNVESLREVWRLMK